MRADITGKNDAAGYNEGRKEGERAKKCQIQIESMNENLTIPTHDDTVLLYFI